VRYRRNVQAFVLAQNGAKRVSFCDGIRDFQSPLRRHQNKVKNHSFLLSLILFLSPVLHPSFFILANDGVVVTPPGYGLQGIFQDLKFPASHPLLLLSIIPNGIDGSGSRPSFTDSLMVTGSPNINFPGTARVAFLDAANVFTAVQTIDLGDTGSTPTEGFVMRNDTPATASRPFQNAPLIVFEGHGYVGGFDHRWEMNEKFFTRSLLGSRSAFTWQFSQNEGPYVDKQEIDSDGNYWGAGSVYAVGGFIMIDNLTGRNDTNRWTANGDLTTSGIIHPAGYQSSDGTRGATNVTDGLTFKDGLYTGGTATSDNVTTSAGPVATIATNTITNAESATMSGGTINRNNTTGAPNPSDITVAEFKSMLALRAADIAHMPAEFCIALSDETTAITAGTAKVTWRAPYAFTIDSVRASLSTASTSGILAVDINENGTSILSTDLTIDQGARTSVTATNPVVISNPIVTDDAEITMDVNASGTNAKGLKVWILGHK
jgi:hypothetical protein